MNTSVLDIPHIPDPLSNPDALVWVCAFCGQLRLLPYGRPFPNDAAATCAACGDLLIADVAATQKALAHVIAEFLQ